MNLRQAVFSTFALALALNSRAAPPQPAAETLSITDQEYLEMAGLNVMLAQDFYPEGHQGGVSVIQNGQRKSRSTATPLLSRTTPHKGQRM